MNVYVYSKYSDCVIVFANSKYEALGRLMCEKDEQEQRRYYVDEDDIVEVPVPNKTDLKSSVIYNIHDIKNKENEQ